MTNFLLDDAGVRNVMNKGNNTNFSELALVIDAFSSDYAQIYIPPRFSKKVVAHVVAPYLNNENAYKPPLYLAIKGEPGEGKTVQTISSCVQKGFSVVYVSASNLSGSHEDEAKEKIKAIYEMAITMRSQKLTAIVIDDFHKGIVNEDSNKKKTINTDVLTGYMMNLAEHNGNIHVPIILTANDLGYVYAPLLRVGRADVFEWIPTEDEKRDVVKSILIPFIKNDDANFDRFFKKIKKENIAFFAQLKNYWRNKIIQESLATVQTLDFNIIMQMDHQLSSVNANLTYDYLYVLSQEMKKERGES